MDLISQIIQNKTSDKKYDLTDILKELIYYEKMSRLKKFQHITESTLLQEKMPICWNAFNNDNEALTLLVESKYIVSELTSKTFEIYKDLNEYYSKKELKHLLILGRIKHPHRSYQSLIDLASNDSYTDVLNNATIISEPFINDQIRIAVITGDTIFTGAIKNKIDKKENKLVKKSYKYSQDENIVEIYSFSNQGNNDYNFATLNEYHVSMPNTKLIRYTANKKEFNKVLNENDQRELSINNSDMKAIAKIIIKYRP